jgi:hypothetical protein
MQRPVTPLSGWCKLVVVLAGVCAVWPARAGQPGRPPFDFAAAERAADQQLKRQPAPVEAKKPETPKLPGPPLCPACKNALVIPCPMNKAQPPFIAKGQPPAERCPQCQGLGYVVCPQCKGKKELQPQIEEVQAKIKTALETAQGVLKEMDELEAADRLNLKITGYVAPHFSIATTLDRKTIVPCIQHGEGLLEKLAGEFRGGRFLFTLPADTRFVYVNSQAEYKVYLEKVWKERYPDTDLALAAKGSGNHTATPPSTGVSCFERISRNPLLLQHNTVHLLGHFLLARVTAIRSYPTWLDEGFAAYAETLELGQPWVYCFAYTANQMDILKNRDASLRKMAQQGKFIPMDRLTQITFMDMKAEEYFQSWSLVTMLVERDPDKFIAFVQAMPDGERDPGGLRVPAPDQEKALLEAYGWDFPKMLTVWQRWVLR